MCGGNKTTQEKKKKKKGRLKVRVKLRLKGLKWMRHVERVGEKRNS